MRWSHRRWSPIVAFLAALLVSGVLALRAPDTVQGDERGFLYYGTMQTELFWACIGPDRGACRDWRWAETYDGYGSRNPKLGMYALGVMDHATRGLPRDQRVPAMRLITGVLGALCVAGVAWLGAAIRPWAGLLAAALLLLHPVFRASQVALLPDISMLLFAIVALLCLHRGLAGRRLRQGAWLLGAGTLVGLAVACKLYALALVPVVLGVAILGRSRLGWHGWVGLLLGLTAGAGAFVGTNPYLWSHPQEALEAMTTGHVAAQSGTLGGPGTGWESLRYLTWLPFSILLPDIDARTQVQDLGPMWCNWIGLALAAAGLAGQLRRRRWTPLILLVCTFALAAWVVTRFDPGWLYPRAFLLPSLAVVWVWAGALELLGRR